MYTFTITLLDKQKTLEGNYVFTRKGVRQVIKFKILTIQFSKLEDFEKEFNVDEIHDVVIKKTFFDKLEICPSCNRIL